MEDVLHYKLLILYMHQGILISFFSNSSYLYSIAWAKPVPQPTNNKSDYK